MAGKIFIRLVGTLTCIAAIATAWDAEAGWRHRHCRSCCYTPCCVTTCNPCCETSCCTASCDPCARTYASCCYRPSCCGYTVVQEVVVPATCCNGGIASTSKGSTTGQPVLATEKAATTSVIATAASSPATKAAR